MILSFFKRWITLNLTGLFFLSYQNSSIIQQILATHSEFRKDYGEIVIPVWVKVLGKIKGTILISFNKEKTAGSMWKKSNTENKNELLSLIDGNGRRMNTFALRHARSKTFLFIAKQLWI